MLLMRFSTSSTLLLSHDSHSKSLYLYELLIWKLSLFCISWPSNLTVDFSMFLLLLNLHSMYFVLTLLNWNPLDSSASCQISNLALTPLLLSSRKSIYQGKTITWETKVRTHFSLMQQLLTPTINFKSIIASSNSKKTQIIHTADFASYTEGYTFLWW